MSFRNLYTRLRIKTTATHDEIKSAYYNLSKLYHPDVNRDNTTAVNTFRHITEAYQVLGSPSARAAYDKGWATAHININEICCLGRFSLNLLINSIF